MMAMHTIIYERRRALGLTQEQVAEYLGVSAPAVHKWEKGSTYPDITLVPKLARLLKVDLNTLFCFQETLTKQEIIQFQEEVIQQVKTIGIDAGFALAEQKIQEYPYCGDLIEGMALLMQGSLQMSDIPVEERKKYQPMLTAWYERAMHCEDEAIKKGMSLKHRAGFMVVSQYMQSMEYEKAQQVLDRLPEPNLLNKNVFQADLFWKQGKTEEAVKLLQKSLLQLSQSVLGIFSRLVEAELDRGEEKTARKIAEKAYEAACAFDLWGYSRLVGLEVVARKTKNVQESLLLLKQMLAAAEEPWVMNQSPLYYILYSEHQEEIRVTEKVLPPLLTMLESDPAYDFLREEQEFQELLDQYRKPEQH